MEGKGLKYDSSAYIVPAKGYTPQMGALVSMLNNLSARVEKIFGPMIATFEARDKFKGKDVSCYLNEFRTVRKKTLEELAKRDDEWLLKDLSDWGANNYWGWFHVMEHQSSHLVQGLLIQKRIPKKEMNTTLQKLEH
jgi:hypothetical protein